MIVAIIPMKIHYIVPKEHALQIALDVLVIGVYRQHGTVMVMTIVEMVQTNLQSIAKAREGLALVIFSLVIMETAFPEFTFVMEIMIASIIVMKINDINAVSTVS